MRPYTRRSAFCQAKVPCPGNTFTVGLSSKEPSPWTIARASLVVTGASSGIGNACATFLAKKGNRVYGTCRDPASYGRKADEFFEMLPMELTDTASVVKAAARQDYSAERKVDALVCCAGSGLIGSIEDSSIEEAESMMDVNYLGTLRAIKAFLPGMRGRGKGAS